MIKILANLVGCAALSCLVSSGFLPCTHVKSGPFSSRSDGTNTGMTVFPSGPHRSPGTSQRHCPQAQSPWELVHQHMNLGTQTSSSQHSTPAPQAHGLLTNTLTPAQQLEAGDTSELCVSRLG